MKGTPVHSASSTLRSRVTPGSLLDDRGPPTDDAVDQGGLAHVGAPGDDHQGPSRGCRSSGRVIGAAPRVDRRLADGASGPVRSDRVPIEGPAEREPVGGHDLDRPGQVGQGQAVEEPPLGEAGVGQQVAVPVGLAVEGPGEVGRR